MRERARQPRSRPIGPPRSRTYRQLWRVVDGAVRDALAHHEDYLTEKGRCCARASITKRVTGAVMGYAVETAKGRSGASPAAEGGAGHPDRRHPMQAFYRACRRLWRWPAGAASLLTRRRRA